MSVVKTLLYTSLVLYTSLALYTPLFTQCQVYKTYNIPQAWCNKVWWTPLCLSYPPKSQSTPRSPAWSEASTTVPLFTTLASPAHHHGLLSYHNTTTRYSDTILSYYHTVPLCHIVGLQYSHTNQFFCLCVCVLVL